jgi:argininosuccinate lyase
MKVWEKRFPARKENPLLEAFNASIEQDRFLYQAEIKASLAYAQALQQAACLTKKELQLIRAGLKTVKKRIEAGENLSRFEDIHSAVELMLTQEIGDTGKKLHSGRSRNEQVVTDERLYLKEKLPRIIDLLKINQRSVIRLAEENADIIMPGYTHLQQAQYVMFSHYIMSLFWPLERATSRLKDALERTDSLSLGVGALAGSTIPINREWLRKTLGFGSITENSMDTVSDRSFILETLFVLAVLLLDLSRFAEDFIIFSSREFGFLALDDSLATSSSLMPQKKNPDFFELIRAGPGRLFGYLSSLFIAIKGLPSTYNKDLQQDKIPLHQGIEETIQILKVFNYALTKFKLNKKKLAGERDSFLFATDLVDYLVKKGLSFRKAHGLAGEIVQYAEKKGLALNALGIDELRRFDSSFGEDVFEIFDPLQSVKMKKTYGSTHPEQVKAQIAKAKKLAFL